MKRRQTTIKDIAKELGISKSTVSRALRAADDINIITKQKVLDTAKKLDYYPNASAVRLFEGKTHTIGVIIPAFTIPFYARVISNIQIRALQSGYNLIVCQTNESYEQEKQNIEILIRNGVDGIAISMSRETKDYKHILKLKEKGIPVVLFNRVIENVGLSTITIDDFEGAKKAVQHLVDRGRKKIACISGPSGLKLSEDRLKGYKEVLKENNIAFDSKLVYSSDFSLQDGKQMTVKLLQKKYEIDAIFCVCDQVAYGAMETLKAANISIPEDIAIAGFTNESISSITSPPLTTINQPMELIGEAVAETLLNHISHFSTNYHSIHKKFKSHLVIRSST